MQRCSIWILCYGEVQEYPSVQRRTGMMDMRNVDFCNRSLVFNHCHSWGIQLPSFLSFKSFITGKFTHYSVLPLLLPLNTAYILKELMKLPLHANSIYRHIRTHHYIPLSSIADLRTHRTHQPFTSKSVTVPTYLFPLN